ncbi:type II secretion system F family protein [Fusibacter sp. JL216-2]|uniref:type II secretion system F family protein n=1 Tax=Fusibacter sp. JL216-2 TaxID=3071453 RepID=UPI003D34FF98
MPIFQYKAKNLQGQIITGKQEAENTDEIKKALFSKGYFLVESHQVSKEFSFRSVKKVKLKDFVIFCNQFSIMLDSGVTLIDSVSVLKYQTGSKVLARVLEEIHASLLKGIQFSDCIVNYPEVFPSFFVNMIKVGEATGSMDVVLFKLADYYENESKISKKIKSASLYPKLVVCAALGVITFLMIKILPMFAQTLDEMGATLPKLTLVLMAVSRFMVQNFFIMAGLFIGGAIALSRFAKTKKGQLIFDRIKVSSPLVGNLTRKIVTAKFARSMGLLLQSGIPMVNAMEIMANLIENAVVKMKFRKCCEDVKAGKSISSSLETMDIFPKLLVHMVHTGEKTGKLDEMLNRTAKFFDSEVEHGVNQMITLIEPVLIISLAVIVGTILLSVMLPMMSIMENMA